MELTVSLSAADFALAYAAAMILYVWIARSPKARALLAPAEFGRR